MSWPLLNRFTANILMLREQLGGVIVGLDDVIEELVIALLCRGTLHPAGHARTGEDAA